MLPGGSYGFAILTAFSQRQEPQDAFLLEPVTNLAGVTSKKVQGVAMGSVLRDTRHSFRMLRKSAGFTCVAVLMLGLGMGASTAIFSIVEAVLLRPLPFPNAERIFAIWDVPPPQMHLGFGELPLHNKEFLFIGSHSRSLEGVAAFKSDEFNLNGESHSERIDGIRASGDFFRVIGVPPQFGRAFLAEEDQPGREHVVVVSHSLWRRRFAADPALVGKTVRLNSETYTVIGIMPEGFTFPRGAEMPKSMQFPKQAELWVPLALTAAYRGPSDLALVARARAGISPGQASADLREVNRELVESDPGWKGWANFKLVPLRAQVEGDSRPRLWMLAGAVVLVLFITCANVSNLFLARSLGRFKDFAVRAALGARRIDLVRQLLTESLLLALSGTVLGTLLSLVIVQAVKRSFLLYVPRLEQARLNLPVLAFAGGLTICVGILFGVFPALYMSGLPLADYLKSREQKHSSKGVNSFRQAMVAGQVGVSLVLVIGTGIFARSFINLLKTNPGFQAGHLITMEVTVPALKYSSPDAVTGVYQRILDRFATVPGIQSEGMVKPLPMSGSQEETVFTIENRPPVKPEDLPSASYTIVSPDYFRAAVVPILSGRAFTEADNAQAPWVTIVSESFARQFWPGQDPVGQRVKLPASWYPGMTIVGVAADVKKFALSDAPAPEMYVPYKQKPYPSLLTMSVVLRTTLTASSLANELREGVKSVDPELAVANLQPMEELVSLSMSAQRLSASVLGAFSAAALILTVIGIYAVVAFMVNERTCEIGIRLALGAQRSDILRLIFGQGTPLVGWGVAIGLTVALCLTRLLSSFVFGITATDPATFVLAPALLVMASSLAIYIPARRASRVDPVNSLRSE
jgi:putative ABC transport system permease protein